MFRDSPYALLLLLIVVGLTIATSLLGGPLAGSQLLLVIVKIHLFVLGLLFIGFLLSCVRKSKQNKGGVTGYSIRQKVFLLLFLSSFILAYVAQYYFPQEYDYSYLKRNSLPDSLSTLLRDGRFESVQITFIEGGEYLETEQERRLRELLSKANIENFKTQTLSRFDPEISLRSDISVEEKVLLKVQTMNGQQTYALKQVNAKAIEQALRPLITEKKQIGFVSSQTILEGNIDSFSTFRDSAKQYGYEVQSINNDDLADIDALIAVDDNATVSSEVVSLLKTAMDRKLPFFLFCEPSTCRESYIKETLNVDTGDNILIDRMIVAGGVEFGVTLLLDDFVENKELPFSDSKLNVLSHSSTTLRLVDEAFKFWTPVLRASASGWGETSPYQEKNETGKVTVALDANDYIGDLYLAAVQLQPTRAAIYGDASILENQLFGMYDNSRFVFELLHWMLESEEQMIAENPRFSVISMKEFENIVLFFVFLPLLVMILFLLPRLMRSWSMK